MLGLRIDHALRSALETIAKKSNVNLSQACRELLIEGARARGFKLGLWDGKSLTSNDNQGEHS